MSDPFADVADIADSGAYQRGQVQTSRSGKTGRVDTTTYVATPADPFADVADLAAQAKPAQAPAPAPAPAPASAPSPQYGSSGFAPDELQAHAIIAKALQGDPQAIKQVWNSGVSTARSGLEQAGGGVAGLLGGVVSGLGAAYEAPWGQKLQAGADAFQKEAPSEQAAYLQQAQAGKGIPNLASDPMNALLLVPGLGEAVKVGQATGLSRAALLGAKYVAAPALENAGIVAASEFGSPGGVNSGDVSRAAVLGGGAGLLGAGIKTAAIDNFPGAVKYNRILEKQGKQPLSPADLESYLKQVNYPGTRGQFETVVDKLRDDATEKYRPGMAQVDPMSQPEFASLPKGSSQYEAAVQTSIKNSALIPELRQSIIDNVGQRNKTSRLKLTHSEIEKLTDDYLDRVTGSAFTQKELGHANGIMDAASQWSTPEQLKHVPGVPLISPAIQNESKSILNSDIYNRKIGENAAQQRNFSGAVHDVVNDNLDAMHALEGGKYSDYIGNAPNQYRKAKTLDALLEGRNQDAQHLRLNFGPIAPYITPHIPMALSKLGYGLAGALQKPFAGVAGDRSGKR